MKNLLITLFISSMSAIASAQPDESYYGRYTDNKDLTGYEFFPIEDREGLEDYCFLVSKDNYDPLGQTVYAQVGYARCEMVNGQYAVELESDEVNLWLTFETDQFGNKSVTAIQKDNSSETFFYNPLDEEDPEVLYAGDAPQTDVYEYSEEPDIYIREDGVGFLIGEIEGLLHFMIIGSDVDPTCASADMDGVLIVDDAARQSYSFERGGCTLFTVKIEEGKAILTEKSCPEVRSKSCLSWSGVYELDN